MPLDGHLLDNSIRWTLVPRPFSTEREERYSPAGLSLAQMLLASDLPERYWHYLEVYVDDEEIPREW